MCIRHKKALKVLMQLSDKLTSSMLVFEEERIRLAQKRDLH
jgi:hypothetical protein